MAVKKVSFRATSGYVTDAVDTTYCLNEQYPTTRNGMTFGWPDTGGDRARNRNDAIDVRLAGVNQCANDGSSQSTFRIDLDETGAHDITLAIGDATNAQGDQYIQVKDDSSVLFTIDDTDGTAFGSFDDANAAEYSAANWPASNTPRAGTFATTICYVIVGTGSAQSNNSTLAHLAIVSTAGGASVVPVLIRQYRQRAA